jgi:hypothetical protein
MEDNTTKTFSYVHPLDKSELKDGKIELTRTGLLVTCYGGENLYSIHYTPMQNGAQDVVLVSQQCDSYIKVETGLFFMKGVGGTYVERLQARDKDALGWIASKLPEEIRKPVEELGLQLMSSYYL